MNMDPTQTENLILKRMTHGLKEEKTVPKMSIDASDAYRSY